jgi:hypothetical protein
MKPICVIVPTRNRPHNIGPLVESMKATMALDTHLLLAVDEDDPKLADYRALTLPEWVTLQVGPPMMIGPSLNYWSEALIDDYEAIGFFGDDNRPRTVGWDWRVMKAMPPFGVVYCNDLIQRWKLPTAVFLDSALVRHLGYFAAPGVIHLYNDDAWKLLGERLGTLTYLGDTVIEHCHPLVGTAETDEGYERVNSGERWSVDGPAFDAWRDGRLDRDIERIRMLDVTDSPFFRNAFGC